MGLIEVVKKIGLVDRNERGRFGFNAGAGIGGISGGSSETKDWKHRTPKGPPKIDDFIIKPCRIIECVTKVLTDYDSEGNLVINMYFEGIRFTKSDFLKSVRDHGPGSAVIYTRIECDGRYRQLILATKSDIFEYQIVPYVMDIDIIFGNELHLPQLATIFDPTSMAVVRLDKENNTVAVGYRPFSAANQETPPKLL